MACADAEQEETLQDLEIFRGKHGTSVLCAACEVLWRCLDRRRDAGREEKQRDERLSPHSYIRCNRAHPSPAPLIFLALTVQVRIKMLMMQEVCDTHAYDMT
jgi:hypothetical protein